jgi:hypothetical protein
MIRDGALLHTHTRTHTYTHTHAHIFAMHREDCSLHCNWNMIFHILAEGVGVMEIPISLRVQVSWNGALCCWACGVWRSWRPQCLHIQASWTAWRSGWRQKCEYVELLVQRQRVISHKPGVLSSATLTVSDLTYCTASLCSTFGKRFHTKFLFLFPVEIKDCINMIFISA